MNGQKSLRRPELRCPFLGLLSAQDRFSCPPGAEAYVSGLFLFFREILLPTIDLRPWGINHNFPFWNDFNFSSNFYLITTKHRLSMRTQICSNFRLPPFICHPFCIWTCLYLPSTEMEETLKTKSRDQFLMPNLTTPACTLTPFLDHSLKSIIYLVTGSCQLQKPGRIWCRSLPWALSTHLTATLAPGPHGLFMLKFQIHHYPSLGEPWKCSLRQKAPRWVMEVCAVGRNHRRFARQSAGQWRTRRGMEGGFGGMGSLILLLCLFKTKLC